MAVFDNAMFDPQTYAGGMSNWLQQALQTGLLGRAIPPQDQPTSMGNYGGTPYPIYGQAPATTELSAQSVQQQQQQQPQQPNLSLMDRIGAMGFNTREAGIIPGIMGAITGEYVSGKPTDDIREFEYARRQGFKGTLADWMARKRAGAGEYGLQPVWGVGPDGKPAVMQLGKAGTAIQSKLPEGFQIAREPIKMDAGTHWVILDPQTRQPVATVPKDLAGEVKQKKQGEFQSTLPTDVMNAEQTVRQIDEFLGHKGFDSVFGTVSQFVPESLLGDAGARWKQLTGKAFVQGLAFLRGFGPVTEVEGIKAGEAQARLSRAQSPEDAKIALKDFRDAVTEGIKKVRERAGVSFPSATQTQKPAVDPILEAKDAIARGAPRDKVLERLRQRGINPSGL